MNYTFLIYFSYLLGYRNGLEKAEDIVVTLAHKNGDAVTVS